MKLLDKLIEDLSSNTTSLTDILIKTKVLAHKTRNGELNKWIDHELNGYPNNEILPPYRIMKCQVIGNVSNGYQRMNNTPIPLTNLDENIQKGLLEAKFWDSISVVEGFLNSNDGNKIWMAIPADHYGYLSKDFANGYFIEYARKEFDKRNIIQILTAVRSKLLDFILNLSDELGNSEELTTIKDEKSVQKYKEMFNSAVFGDNNVIILGNDNQTDTKFISKDNFDSLEKTFIKNGIHVSEIDKLKQIIDSDNPDHQTKTFGLKVKGWISEMINKSLNGTWEIGLGAAGSLLSDAIKMYYGWK